MCVDLNFTCLFYCSCVFGRRLDILKKKKLEIRWKLGRESQQLTETEAYHMLEMISLSTPQSHD